MAQPTNPAPPPATPVAPRTRANEWLLGTLSALLTPEQCADLRNLGNECPWAAAVARGWTTDERILTALSSRYRMKVANLAQVSPQAVHEVTESLARRYHVVPLAISDASVEVATSNPHDLDCERTLGFRLGRRVKMLLAAPGQIDARIDELYRPENVIEKILGEAFTGVDDLEAIPEDPKEEFEFSLGKATDRPIIRLVDRIVAKAIQQHSSDIHLEPRESGVMVRYRIDGVLTDDSIIPRALGAPLVARVKIMAQLDIADRLRPQDGRARVGVGGARIDLRISTLPAALGEKVVIRILDSRHTVLALDGLGLHAGEIERIRTLLQVREGMVFVTGPTGSGKTTTLYSIVREVQLRGVNIVTVEDPVEYRLQGIVQVQVNEKTGLTFPSALRSILRQDPDVILVGEIRDRETAQIAVQASLTGHLVLTTLHTIDAASSVTRLSDIGIEPYKTAAALKGIVAQRLLRRLCTHCRVPAAEPLPASMRRHIPAGVVVFDAAGCAECSNTGYRGRLAITEVLVSSADLERRIAANESPERIGEVAREAGMRSLWDSALQQVRDGTTSVAEVMRVLGAPSHRDQRRRSAPAAPAPHSQQLPPVSGVPVRGHVLEGCAFDLLDDANGDEAVGRRSVLVVDQEAAGRRAACDALERDGFTAHGAEDGAQALDRIDRFAPDAIVLHLQLPRLDGYGVLSHLRARPATRDIPVIAIAATSDEDAEVRAFEHGASGYLARPFGERALTARLHALLARR